MTTEKEAIGELLEVMRENGRTKGEVILPPDPPKDSGPVTAATEIIILMRVLGLSFTEARALSKAERANFIAALTLLDEEDRRQRLSRR